MMRSHYNNSISDSVLDVEMSQSNQLVVASSSMEPTLCAGDKISVEFVVPEDIVSGMVIVFKTAKDRKIVHRVVEKRGMVLITAGDSLRKFDRPIHIYDVVAKVTGLEIKDPLSKSQRFFRAIKRRILSV